MLEYEEEKAKKKRNKNQPTNTKLFGQHVIK